MARRGLAIVAATALLGFASFASALEVPPNVAPVVDRAGLLDATQKAQLDESLTRFQQEKGPQIQVLIIPSLEGEALESYSIRVADAWKTGKKGADDGVILLLALKDRKARLEVGKGLEGALPDILAGRIIRDTLAPYFKAGRYADGIYATTQEIAARLGGQLQEASSFRREAPVAQRRQQGSFLTVGHLLPLILFLFLFLPRIFGGGNSGRSGASGMAAGMILGGLLGGGRRDGGGGGGIFGGGGGGGFNGGGASGEW